MKIAANIPFVALIIVLITVQKVQAQSPLFQNSVVSNNIDFILETDTDAFVSLSFIGLDDKEMPSSLSNVLFDVNTYIFEATFNSGPTVEIWCHSSFGSQNAAQEYAEKLCPRLGKLPSVQRDMLHHVVIHTGNATAFAETQGNFFVLYAQNMDVRISDNDLEETVFHESVHASIQEIYENSPAWLSAQSSDSTCVTVYGLNSPTIEDMAESALFAYTYLIHPGRLSPAIETWLVQNNPNRLEFFREIYLPNSVGFTNTGKTSAINVFPNPTQSKITFVMDDEPGHDDVARLYTTNGNLITSCPLKKGHNEIDLENLSKGLYLLFISNHVTLKISKL